MLDSTKADVKTTTTPNKRIKDLICRQLSFIASIITLYCVIRCDYGANTTFIKDAQEEEDPTSTPKTQKKCTNDFDCSNGKFCDGRELCEPLSPEANEKGCVKGEPPCSSLEECDNKQLTCTKKNKCDLNPDEDNDGHLAEECGGDDCDDNDADRFRGKLEFCDEENHDEDCDPRTYGKLDADGDGFYNRNCCNIDSNGKPFCGNDCDDNNDKRYPGNQELCDGLDNDCNGKLDHPFEDIDQDSYASKSCGGADCDDQNPNVYPGAVELCDGLDTDCLQEGGPVRDEYDADGDGYVTADCIADDSKDGLKPNDCYDTISIAHPNGEEVCNFIDDDCDGLTDEGIEGCDNAIRQFDVGLVSGCAVRGSGTVACWGLNQIGQLGTSATTAHIDANSVIDMRNENLLLSNVKSVSAGYFHYCALHNDGRVSCWGDNSIEGRLGIGSKENQVFFPQEVTGLDDIVQVSVGAKSACALDESGSVWCWGDNSYGQLGDGTEENRSSPVKVTQVRDVKEISCGAFFTCAVLHSGATFCWGDIGAELLDRDINTIGYYGPIPNYLYGLEDVTSVSAAKNHACAVYGYGNALCWGANSVGQLGCGFYSEWEENPQQVLSLSIDAPLNHIVQIATGGGVSQEIGWVWNEDEGQMDQIQVEAQTGISCARTAIGVVYCWGSNQEGELGIGELAGTDIESASNYRQHRALIPVSGINAVDISATAEYVCARSSTAEIWCWGGADDEGWTSNMTPQKITGFED